MPLTEPARHEAGARACAVRLDTPALRTQLAFVQGLRRANLKRRDLALVECNDAAIDAYEAVLAERG